MARKTTYNSIVTPELMDKINPVNIELMNDFLLYLQSINRSKGTIYNYKSDLSIFFIWVLQHSNNKPFNQITKRNIVQFQNYLLNTNKNSPARVRRVKACISSLSNYVENILDEEPEYQNFRNIINKIENPVNTPSREKTVFNPEDLQLLLDWLIENKEYQRACIVALAMYSGRRKSELLRFKVSHFTKDNIIYGSLYKTPEKIKTKGRGDGKYLSCYVLANKFQPYLDMWITERNRLGITNDELFVVYDDTLKEWKPMQIASLNYMAQVFTNFLKQDFYFHSLRHFFTTELTKAKLPSNVIQGILGWSSLEMVSVYSDLSTDDVLGDYFDENGIKEVKTKSLSEL